MTQTKERIQNLILFIVDALCILMGYCISGLLWLSVYKAYVLNTVLEKMYSNLFTIVIAYVVLIIIYSEKNNFVSRTVFQELKEVFKKNVVFACLVAISALFKGRGDDFPRGVYVLTIILAIAFMFAIHLVIKQILISRSKGKNALRLILITTYDRAKASITKLDEQDDWMRKLSGVIIIDKSMVGKAYHNIPIVADGDSMMEYIKKEVADEVYIDMTYENIESLKPIVMELEEMGITVHIRLDVLDAFDGFDVTLSRMGGDVVATFAHKINAYKKLVIKRCIDIVGSLVGICIMGVAMIFVAPAIMIESKGPIFFKQKRVGKGGRYFEIYKFRSMYMDAEERKKELMAQNEMDGLMFKMEDDPRITKVGKFIRKTSIDELPQFINVLKGDMSLVGTRPPTVAEFNQYEGHHKRRLTMKPGITGMWQAYGRNSVVNFEEVVKMDVEYIDNWSLSLDLKILLKTIVTVFTVGGK